MSSLGWLILLLGLLLINSGWTLFGEPCGYEAGEIPNQPFFLPKESCIYINNNNTCAKGKHPCQEISLSIAAGSL